MIFIASVLPARQSVSSAPTPSAHGCLAQTAEQRPALPWPGHNSNRQSVGNRQWVNNDALFNTLSNTDRVYQLIWIAIISIFIIVSVICIWIGIPKPHLWRFRLAASFFVVGKQHVFSKEECFNQYLSIRNIFTYFRKHQIDAERNSMQNDVRTLSWTLS